jgi:hypothetical protein
VSLLESVTNVADEAGYNVGSTVVGSSDITSKQLLAIANRIIGEMGDRYPWPALWKSHTESLSASDNRFALPGDFSRYHFDTWWNGGRRWPFMGPMSEIEYAAIRGYGITATPYDRFTINGVTDQTVLIYPTPSATTTIQFEYVSARYVRPQTHASGISITAGDYIFYNGNYYLATTSGVTGATSPTHTSSTASDGTVTWQYYSGTYLTFLADTDEPIFSSRILEQGMLERFATIKSLNVDALFDDQLEAEFCKARPGRSFSLVEDGGPFMAAEAGRVIFGGFR